MIGEHIRALKDGRWVHAIDCGDETVLHLVEDAAPRRVRRAYRPEFVAGARSVEVVTHRERTFAPEEIVRRAYSRSSDPALAQMFVDSEAFAEWCTSGRVPAPRNVVARPSAPPAPPSRRPAAAAQRARPAKARKATGERRRPSGKAARAGKERGAPERRRPPKRSAARGTARRKPVRRRGGRGRG